MRCGSRLVQDEMLMAEVQSLCGAPALRDRWAEPGPYVARPVAVIEQWTYNFGSSRLLRVLRFRNGRLETIETEGYGFPEPAARSCAMSDMRDGMSKYRLLARCGEPIDRIQDYVGVPLHTRNPYGQGGHARYGVIPVYREEWTYNFGPNQLMRIVTLENGYVVDVDTGRRGFYP